MSLELPGKILEEYMVRKNRLGLVQFGDTCRPIFLDLLPNAHVGDYVRVRSGFATECVDQGEATKENGKLRKNMAEQVLEAQESSPDAKRRVKPR